MPEQNPILSALQTSIIVNRRDQPGQIAWTEWRTGLVLVGGTAAQAGDLALLGPNGKFDPSVIPTTGSTVSVNGTPVSNPNFNDLNPGAPLGFTNVKWQFDGSGNVSAYYATSGTTVAFGSITSGTNLGQALVVGNGSTLTVACPGTGVIEATELATDNCAPVVTNTSHPTHAGQLLISQPGNTSAAWADPLVQGLYPDNSVLSPAPAFVAPTTIQPILVGGAGGDGHLHQLAVTVGGQAIVLSQDKEADASILRFAATTGVSLKTNITNTLKPIISIRPKAAATGVTFTLRTSNFLSQGQITHYQLLFNATLTGASFADADAASNAQFDVAATSYTGGRIIDSGFIGADHERSEFELHFGFTGGVPDTLTLVFAPVSGSAKSSSGATLAWDEQASAL